VQLLKGLDGEYRNEITPCNRVIEEYHVFLIQVNFLSITLDVTYLFVLVKA
jgi:hypothetical protein